MLILFLPSGTSSYSVSSNSNIIVNLKWPLSPGRYPIIYQKNKPWKKTQVNHQIPYLRLQILLSSSHHFTAFLYLLSPFQLLTPSLVPTTTGLTSSNQSSYTKARITVHACTHISAHHFPIWVGPNPDPLSPTKRPRDLTYSPIKQKGCVYTRKSDSVNQQKKVNLLRKCIITVTNENQINPTPIGDLY